MRFRFTMYVLLLLLSGSASAADELLAIGNDGWLVSINPVLGRINSYHVLLDESQGVLQSAQGAYASLTTDPQGQTLYALQGSNLYSINANTLRSTLLGAVLIQTPNTATTSPSSISWNSATQSLYALVNGGPTQYLYSIDPGTLKAKLVTTLQGANGLQNLICGDDGIIYALSQSKSVLSIDPSAGTSQIIQSIIPSSGVFVTFNLAKIPGKPSFYLTYFDSAGPAVGLIDTSARTFTPVGPAAPAGFSSAAVFRNLPVEVEANPSSTGFTYSIEDVCAPSSCLGSLLNDGGAVAGGNLNGTGDPFALYPGQGIVDLTLKTGQNFVPTHMNNAGDISGSFGTYLSSQAAVYVASEGQLIDLNPVFGWSNAAAVYINDHGEIVGAQTGNYPPIPTLVKGYLFDQPIAITNDEVILGRSSATSIQIFPDGRYLSSIKSSIGAFNNSGQAAFVPSYYTMYPDQHLYFGPPYQVLPVGAEFLPVPVDLNDSGLLLLATVTADPLLYDTRGAIGPISSQALPLRYFLPPDSGWSNLSAQAINNAGQILVNAMDQTGRTTALVLTPRAGAQEPPVVSQNTLILRQRSSCGLTSLNGVALDCGRLRRVPGRATRPGLQQ